MTFHDLFQDTLNVFTTLDEEVGFIFHDSRRPTQTS